MKKDEVKLQPAVFIGHGNPMNAIEGNAFTLFLTELGKKLAQFRPQMILVISAHWETKGTNLTSNQWPKTIHDFYGFPKKLSDFQYPAPGSVEFAKTIQLELSLEGVQIELDESWGLDHGSWSVLTHIFPKADRPVLQLSLDLDMSSENHLELGRKLAKLRSQGVLILGSGNIVHNLKLMNWNQKHVGYDWANSFNNLTKQALIARDEEFLTNYETTDQNRHLSVPTLEHYWPALYVFAASVKDEPVEFLYEGMEYGSLSMMSFGYGVSK